MTSESSTKRIICDSGMFSICATQYGGHYLDMTMEHLKGG